MIYNSLLKALMFVTYVTQIAKISQTYLYDIHLHCGSEFDEKLEEDKRKLWSRQYCGIVEKYSLRAICNIFKRYATSYKIQSSFMRYHTIVLVHRKAYV